MSTKQGQSRLQTEERWEDQVDRLRLMADDRHGKWDHSPNDVAAIAAAVKRLDDAAALLPLWREYARIAESKNRAELWTRCADALEAALAPSPRGSGQG